MTDTMRRPGAVTLAAGLHLLIAAAFLIVPIIGLIYGASVQEAAEAEVVRQGLPATLLADNGLRFSETGTAIAVPVLIALGVGALSLPVLSGWRWARIVSWIVLPLVFLGNIAILASNASAAEALRSTFAESGNVDLMRLDTGALVDSAFAAYPQWVEPVGVVRSIVVMGGALLAIVLLAIPVARPHFRRPAPAPGRAARRLYTGR